MATALSYNAAFRPLPEDLHSKSPGLRVLCKVLNRVCAILNAKFGVTGLSPSMQQRSFACSMTGANTCAFTAGYVTYGSIDYLVPAGSVTLSGSLDYVFLYHNRDHSATGVARQNTLPASDGTVLRVRLCACQLMPTGIFVITKVYHDGDVLVDIAMP